MATCSEIIENESVNEKHPFVEGNNLTNMRDTWKTLRDRIY